MEIPGDNKGKGTSQWYIGAQNGVVLCINSIDVQNRRVDGCFYHAYQTEAISFDPSTIFVILSGERGRPHWAGRAAKDPF